MQKNKIIIIITILVLIIIGETIFLFKLNSQETVQKSPEVFAQNIGKGIDGVFVQVRINKETQDGQFTDSLYYSADEWAKATSEDVQKAIQNRVDNWERVIHAGESK
jgi:hypothetical protein